MEGLIINGEFVTAKSNGYVVLQLSFYHDINIIRSFPRITVPDGKLTAIFDTGISLGMYLKTTICFKRLDLWDGFRYRSPILCRRHVQGRPWS